MSDTIDAKISAVLILGAMALFYVGCDGIKSAPKLIDADGQTYVACKDLVWVSSEGSGLLGSSQSFKVSFTDDAGLAHMLRGVKQIRVSDIPAMKNAPMPYNPSTTYDSEGKPLVEGRVYRFAGDEQASFRNGAWEPVKVPNDMCNGS